MQRQWQDATMVLAHLADQLKGMKPLMKSFYRALVDSETTLPAAHGALVHTNRIREMRRAGYR